jgi:O-antigen ligase
VFPLRIRLRFLIGGLIVRVVAALAAGEVRLFNIGLNDTTNLSGRELLWPSFAEAAAQSPWFGWGAGAANGVIPPDGQIARLLHTWAAHNEYLRLSVDGGAIGVALLGGLFIAWVTVHTRGLPPPARRIMRLAFLSLAAHAITDNVLISTPASVLFAFSAAVFARARAE